MKPYPKYKPSGIEWIGEVPEHWSLIKLKYLGESIIGLTYSPNDITDEKNGILVLRSSNIQGGKFSSEDSIFVNIKINEKLRTQIGDILICARNGSADLVGKNILIDEQISNKTFGAFMTIFRGDSNFFVYWFFNSPIFEAQKGAFSTSTINQLTRGILDNLLIAIPPSKLEQDLITSFLDHKTAQIDQIISDKEKLIELYEEEKKVLINEAVTKGLNPDAKMKDSGIEWLGEIPEHWEVIKLKKLTSKIGDGIHTTPKYVDVSDFYFINGNNISNGKIIFTETTKCVDESEYDNHKLNLIPGTILLSINGTIGNIGIYNNERIILGKSAAYLSCVDTLFNYFLYYSLQSNYITNAFEVSLNGTTIKNLSLDTIRNTYIAIPPLTEQKEIVERIKNKLTDIEELILVNKKEIDLLKEYRQSLIFEAVTGKIDVREPIESHLI